MIYFSFVLIIMGRGELHGQEFAPSKRPFYEYKGNYGEQIKTLKSKFKESFGYELVDMGRNWSPNEIELLHAAFKQLPFTFYGISELKALYRLENLVLKAEQGPMDDVPAATLPSFSTIYENTSQSYKVFVEQQELRVEFYNPPFYEDQVDTAVAGLTQMLEPFILVFLGVVVGGILIAMYMPMFKMADVIK